MMTDTQIGNSFLLEKFREFYAEVMVQKKIVRSGTELSSAPDSPAECRYSYPIRSRLLNVLDRQIPEARRQGGEYGMNYYKEAQYVMAALADEIFLSMDWKGREEWKSALLEFELFGTYMAGELLFQKADSLLKERDPARTEMASVYLLAISLGFRGKFGDKDDGGKLDSYRRQLYAFIFQKNPELSGADSRKLFPESYAYTLTQGDEKKLPHLKIWIWLLIGLIALFLIVSSGIWAYYTDDLRQVVNNIISEIRITP
ncbi:MAG: DotU family type IV/VI secretion system protein [Desulfobacteraceae bacterium]|nr:DotU family type IV/VI secretion system protein [Desulfobacteraceae bacterium]